MVKVFFLLAYEIEKVHVAEKKAEKIKWPKK